MKLFRAPLSLAAALLAVLTLPAPGRADDVVLSGTTSFASLDGSADDHDGTVNGVFTVNDGNLTIEGTVTCNDDPPLAGSAGACPIKLAVSGDLTLEAGSGIFAENRRNSGSGGNITLTVGGDLVLHGPAFALPGAVISSGRTTGSGAAGDIKADVGGAVELEAGTAVSAGTPNGTAGAVRIAAGGAVHLAGLVASGPSRTVLASKLTGSVLTVAGGSQAGGLITIQSTGTAEPAVRVDAGGVVVSQGEDPGAGPVSLEGCGIEIRGLVASVSKSNGLSSVSLRSGRGILVDGTNLGAAGPAQGRVRADATLGDAAGFGLDFFARGPIQVLGPAPAQTGIFVASSTQGTQQNRTGGTIAAISLEADLAATGNAFDAGRQVSGDKGGTIDLKAKTGIDLDGAVLKALGGASGNPGRKGGTIRARAFQGGLSWTFGTGDVRPVGTGAPAASQGSIVLTACTGIDTTGTQFPTNGSPILPFPVENAANCSAAAPVLPVGEPSLAVCNQPPTADPQTVSTDEDTPVTITLTGSDPDGDPLTFSIVTPPAHGALGPLTSPTPTSVQVVYTPAADYSGPDSFEFQVSDGQSSDTATVGIEVGGANDPPVVDEATFSIPENSANGTAVGTVTFTDPDAGQAHTFAITGGNVGGAFAIDPSTGAITVANSAALDFETTPTFSLTVEVTDDGTPVLSGTATVTVNLTNANEAPVVTPATFSVAENSANGTPVGTVTFTDPDAGQSHTFAITGGNTGGAFAIDPSTGAITVANSAVLDFETTSTFSLNVQVTDNGTPVLSGTATVTVNLTNTNEAPVVNPASFSIAENSANGTAVGTVTFTDPDAGQSHTFAITGGNVGGAFAIDPSTGAITVANSSALDFETTPVFNLTVQVTDNGSPALSGTATVTVNLLDQPEAPIVTGETYETVGNTLLEVSASESATVPHVFVSGNLLANDVDPDGATVLTASLASASAGAIVAVNSDGTFTYLPPAGASGTDSFTYNVSDGTLSSTGTVTIQLKHRVWYVKNDAEDDDGLGRSADPFDTLAEAEAASTAGDTIYVFEGDGGPTGQDQGIALKADQRLLGEGVALEVPVSVNGGPNPTVLRPAGDRPQIDNTIPGGNGVSVTDVGGVEIRGLDIAGAANAIDVTTTGTNGGGATIRDDTIRAAGAEGIDVNAGGTGTLTVTVANDDLAATGNAFDARSTAGALQIDFSGNTDILSNASGVVIEGSGGGTVTITGFANNSVHPDTAGTGISITSATFDQTPGGGLDTVDGGTTVIGASGNGVGGAGLVLAGVQGDLHFSGNLDIFADGGAGLSASGTGAGLQVRVASGSAPSPVGIIEATGGPAVAASSVGLDLRLTSLESTNSTTSGVSLTNVSGTLSAESGSAITNATSTDFAIDGGTAAVTYKGTITDDVGQLVSVANATGGTKSFTGAITDGDDGDGGGISLTNNTGAMVSFSGGITLSTGANAAFAATGGGTVIVTGSANTLTTTTGTALNVANTAIGASGLTFRSISAGTAASGPTNGIVLNNTGSLGSLTVSGTGGAGTGGTIQRAGTGISLTSTTSPSFSWVQLNDFSDFAIRGSSVVNFTLASSVINGINGNDAGADEGSVRFSELTGSASISNTSISGSVETNLRIANTTGSLNRLTLSNTTIGANSTTTGDDGLFFEAQAAAAVMNVTVQNSFFTASRGDLAQFNNASSGTMDVVVSGTAFSDNHPAIVAGGGGVVVGAVNGTTTYNVHNNTFRDATGTALAVSCGNAGVSCIGRLENNQIGLAGTPNSGSTNASGIAVVNSGGGTMTSLVNNNVIRQYNNHGILLQAGQTGGNPTSFNATVTNNTIGNPGTINTDFNGIHLNNGTLPGENFTSCVDIRTNSIAGSGTGVTVPNNADFRLRQRQSTTVRLPGYGGANNNDAAVVSFVSGNQTTVTTGAASNTVPTGGGFVGGAFCPTPP